MDDREEILKSGKMGEKRQNRILLINMTPEIVKKYRGKEAKYFAKPNMTKMRRRYKQWKILFPLC